MSDQHEEMDVVGLVIGLFVIGVFLPFLIPIYIGLGILVAVVCIIAALTR